LDFETSKSRKGKNSKKFSDKTQIITQMRNAKGINQMQESPKRQNNQAGVDISVFLFSRRHLGFVCLFV